MLDDGVMHVLGATGRILWTFPDRGICRPKVGSILHKATQAAGASLFQGLRSRRCLFSPESWEMVNLSLTRYEKSLQWHSREEPGLFGF